jgi:hypothetical protein
MRCGEEQLRAWAVLALFRPGVSLDMRDLGSLQAGFAAYAGQLYREAESHLRRRAAALIPPVFGAAEQGA